MSRYFGCAMGGVMFIPSLQTSVQASAPNGEYVMVDIESDGKVLVLTNIEIMEYKDASAVGTGDKGTGL